MQRVYYTETVVQFLHKNSLQILGELAKNSEFELDDLQKNAWLEQIRLLQRELVGFEDGQILFEYTIPRIGHRIDNVLLFEGVIFLLEFKVGEKTYPRYALDQVMDYALDLKNFHQESHDKILVPILISTKAQSRLNEFRVSDDGILDVLMSGEGDIRETILDALHFVKFQVTSNHTICNVVAQISFHENFDLSLDPKTWINSPYMPTPTIIEAAQALYCGHNVEDCNDPLCQDTIFGLTSIFLSLLFQLTLVSG